MKMTMLNQCRRLAIALTLGLLSSVSAHAVDYNWIGSGDWNDGRNWDASDDAFDNMVPSGGGGNFAFVNNGGTAVISSDIPDIQDPFIGHLAEGVGTLNQTGGNTQAEGGTTGWMFVGNEGGVGTYNLSGGTQGKSRLYVGRLGGVGELNLSDNGHVGGEFLILGDGGDAVGTANVTGGTVHTSNEIWVGNGGGNGTLNQSAGSIEGDTWIAIGRDSSTGVANLSGTASLRKNSVPENADSEGSFIIIGGLGTGGSGTLNIQDDATVWSDTGLALNETAGQAATVNQSGGTVTVHDYTPRDFQLQFGSSLELDPNGHGEGMYNLSGGVLNAQTIEVGFSSFNMTGGTLTATDFQGDLTQEGGTTSPGSSPGIMLVTGNYSLVSGDLFMEIEGTGAGTGYDQLQVTGDVSLAGDLTLAGAYVPALGDSFTLIDNQGANAISGAFTGIAEGSIVSFNGVDLTASYLGGDGNDFVLSAVPEPTTIALAGLSLLAMAARRRS